MGTRKEVLIMNDWIDFKELRKQLDFGEVLRHYGVELKLTGDQHHGFCPLPNHNGKRKSPSFSANVKRGVWQCFGCGEGGNLLDFAVLMERGNPKSGEDVRKVASLLKERFLGGTKPSKGEISNSDKEDENVVVNAPLDFELKGLQPNHPYLLDRGFTPETIAHFDLGYCSRGLLANRIAIPLHNERGELVGYAGRVIADEAITEENPKYRFPGRRKRKEVIHEFRKLLLLYNAHRIAAPVDDLVLVEGFAAVWWLHQASIANVVGTMGASCSEEQAKTIVSLVSDSGRVWILTDGDSAGERCALSILIRVGSHRFTRWVRVEAGKQPTGFSPSELRDLLRLDGRAATP
jgi:DNA primase